MVASAPSDLDVIAREHCAKLLKTKAALRFPAQATALVVVAFALGAAWALEKPEIKELAEAQIDALRSSHQ